MIDNIKKYLEENYKKIIVIIIFLLVIYFFRKKNIYKKCPEVEIKKCPEVEIKKCPEVEVKELPIEPISKSDKCPDSHPYFQSQGKTPTPPLLLPFC